MKAPDSILYLSQADVAAAGLGMAEIIDIVERVFMEKGRGGVEMPPKPGIHPAPDSFIHAMPAFVPALDAAAIKLANRTWGVEAIASVHATCSVGAWSAGCAISG